MRPYYYNISSRYRSRLLTEPHRERTGADLWTLAEIKRQCKVDFTDTENDAYLTTLGKIACAAVENYTSRSIIEADITVIIQSGYDDIELPWGPVDIDSVAGVDEDDEDITDLEIIGLGFPVLRPRNGYVKLTYSAGYDSTSLRPDLKHAILCEAAWLYEHRGDEVLPGLHSNEAKLLAQPYKKGLWLL